MILGAIPRILGFIIIVAIGWFISSILARAVIGLLRAIRFDELMQRSGLADFMGKMGTGTDSAGVVAALGEWVRLGSGFFVGVSVLRPPPRYGGGCSGSP